ncbi:MAG: group 1 truncated hemoglobin [Pseudomonadota bacterium]
MPQTMFDRYGGFAAVSKIVLSFYDKAMDSDKIGKYFEHVDLPALIDHQTKFISSVMGGPASYTNEQLERIHSDLAIDNDAMDEMINLLEETLEEFGLDSSDVDHLVDDIRGRTSYIVSS